MRRGTRFDVMSQIFGSDFISFDEIERVFYELSAEQEKALLRIEMEEDELRQYVGSYYLIPHIGGRSIVEMMRQYPKLFCQDQYDDVIHYNKAKPHWVLIAKEFFPGSFGVKWDDVPGRPDLHPSRRDDRFQLVVPAVHILVYAMVVLKIARGIELIPSSVQAVNSCDQARVLMEREDQGPRRILIERFEYGEVSQTTGVIPVVSDKVGRCTPY